MGITYAEYALLMPKFEIYAGTADYRELAARYDTMEDGITENGTEDTAFIYQVYSTRYPADGRYYVALNAISSAQKDAEYRVVITPEEYEADKEFYDQYFEIIVIDKSSTLISRAALGRITAEELEAQPDISNQLFSDASASGGGYLADFSHGPVTFTVLDSFGTLHYITMKLQAAPEGSENLPVIPTSNPGTSFEALGFIEMNPETGKTASPSRTHIVTSNEDSYYRNGYQTVFQDSLYQIEDGFTIFPMFSAGDSLSVYAGMNQNSGLPQKSAETPVENFVSSKPIRYSTAVKDGEHMNNYWVTFVTPVQGRAQLFVNAASNIDDFHRDETGMPVREVLLTQYYNYRHDILIANIGRERLTGIRVKLAGNPDGTGEAANVEIDELYSIGVEDSASLEPFPSWNTDWPNLAKIRLRAKASNGEVQDGKIEGYLIITTENGGNMTVKLTGAVGEPQIITETLSPIEGEDYNAVKYVHYSTFLQTSSMYAADKVSFSVVSGRLPKGATGNGIDVTLNPNGELYGVPEETGDFPFTVRATFYGDENIYSEKSYNLRVADNTDANVWGINDYKANLTANSLPVTGTAVVYDMDASESLIIHTDADYDQFVRRITVDGVELESTEFTADPGSTIATIISQALRNAANNSTHTISMENRAGGLANTRTTLTRTSVNVTVKKASNGSGGTGTGSSGGGGSSRSSGSGSSGRTTAYSITTASVSNGTLRVSPSSAAKGTKVTITATPSSGYRVKAGSITATDSAVSGSGTSYSFTMPDKNVTVSAVFEPLTYHVVAETVEHG
ncbi:MAG: hypothetical protein IJT94_13815, partial [Oscillibacter sp.]|nr:hypothetical protein [Oscillibacter sp.]